MHLPWFRFYTEFATDPVMQSLAFEDQRHFVILLCLKGSGVMDRKISQQARDRIILRGLGLDQVTGVEVKRRLVEVKLITNSWQICGWEARQFDSDSSAERTRKYRKNKAPGNVTDRHGDGAVTPQIRSDTDQDPPYPPKGGKENKSKLITDHNNHLCKKIDRKVGAELREKAAPSTHQTNGSGIFMETCSGELWEVPADKVTEWQGSFPDVDVPLTLLGARQWLRDHPKRRKTALGMVAFLGDWMRREQDKPEPAHAKATRE